MDVCYDLHSHSTASDGTLDPTRLLERAGAAGVDVLALTDHDTLAGLAEADVAACAAGLSLIPGVEISVSWRHMTIHVLGLNVSPAYQPLIDGLAGLQESRILRAEEIAHKLEKSGIAGALKGAQKHCKGNILSRSHFAYFLVETGRAASVRDVFKHYLVRGKPGFVSGQWAPMEEALRWIIDAGGLPVIAHPARYGLTRTKLNRLVSEFQEAGGVGIEVVSGSHSRDEALHMAAIARTRDLFASCGSDFHGPEKPWVELGRLHDFPMGCTPIWQADSWPVIA